MGRSDGTSCAVRIPAFREETGRSGGSAAAATTHYENKMSLAGSPKIPSTGLGTGHENRQKENGIPLVRILPAFRHKPDQAWSVIAIRTTTSVAMSRSRITTISILNISTSGTGTTFFIMVIPPEY